MDTACRDARPHGRRHDNCGSLDCAALALLETKQHSLDCLARSKVFCTPASVVFFFSFVLLLLYCCISFMAPCSPRCVPSAEHLTMPSLTASHVCGVAVAGMASCSILLLWEGAVLVASVLGPCLVVAKHPLSVSTSVAGQRACQRNPVNKRCREIRNVQRPGPGATGD